MLPCTATTVHCLATNRQGDCFSFLLLYFLPQFLEEIPESTAPVLEHPGSPRNLTDRNTKFLCNIPLRSSLHEHLDELPPLCDGIELLGRGGVLSEEFRL